MKNNKGITLTSLVVYIAVIFVVIAALMRIITHYSGNMADVADVSFETEFQKINLYLLDETKKTGNFIQEITEEGYKITFEKGNEYTYKPEEKIIYLNNGIKVCEGVESCLFEEKTADNGKSVLSVTININGTEKNIDYVITSVKGTTLLPAEYQQVEYIESTGTQYIDTKFYPNSSTSIEMKASNESGSNVCLYCSRGPSGYQDKTYTAILMVGKAIKVDYHNTSYQNLATVTRGVPYVYRQNKNALYIDDKLVRIIAETEFETDYSMYLLASHLGNSSVGNMGNIKLYYCKIWDGDTLVRDFIPCYKKSDNKVGLYDMVNNVFYPNLGTGEFIKGEECNIITATEAENYIKEEDYIFNMKDGKQENLPGTELLQVEYIESTGTQYIDTGFIPNSNTSIEMKVSSTSNGNISLYCARGVSGNQDKTYTAFLMNRSYLRVDYSGTSYANIMKVKGSTPYQYIQNKNLVYIDGELVKTLNEEEFSSEYNMYLLASHRGENEITNIGNVKLYYCKIWDGETLVRDFIPCYRKADNLAGLYDLVNGEFYTSPGLGKFLAGPEVE